MLEPWIVKVEELAQQICEREGCRLYDIEITGTGKGRTLRIFIDKEDSLVGIADCTNVSNGLNLLLDVENVVPGGGYYLEVSTPGLDRSLKKPWHFTKVIGKKILVKTTQPLGELGLGSTKWMAAKTIERELLAADESVIEFDFEGVRAKIPYSIIDRAKLVFEMTKGNKK